MPSPLHRYQAEFFKARAHLLRLCPSGAFREEGGVFQLDLARCVGCGRCVLGRPEAVEEVKRLEVAVTRREDLVQRVDLDRGGFLDPGPPPSPRTELRLPTLAFREVSAGDTGIADSEIALLGNPFNDMGRFGFQVVASPRHADALLVTGPVSRNMAEALRPQVLSGVDQVVPVDVYVPGDPPRPGAILHGLMLLVGRMTQRLVGGGFALSSCHGLAPHSGSCAASSQGARGSFPPSTSPPD
ncbi:NADH-quinone oxidoreductase subunit B [Thermus scotoductus]|uniref:NADH-quinone oxidoreductase subunit B n=1 Tax=Thermus scotoductus TaxID=37636 RepID=UPI0020A5E269|nr:NADH-quinone oxidoreductase subunit B [Thermus scotoductus]